MKSRSLPLNPQAQTALEARCTACGAPVGQSPKCPRCGWVTDSRLGTTIANRYRMDAVLGEGGFGKVYRGTRLDSGTVVAIKFLHTDAAARADVRARFEREAQVLSQLRHPGIVAVYEFSTHLSIPYLVMEFIDGQPLSDLLVEDQIVFPLERAVGIVDLVLDVLEAAHARAVVHRDIKPENVMLLVIPGHAMGNAHSSNPTVPSPVHLNASGDAIKVLDFGLAFFEGTDPSVRLTATRATFGSPYYMSPEQCRGRDVTIATDIYAVGIMLYELLSGSPPFLGENMSEILAQHIYSAPPPIEQHGACRKAPQELEAIVQWALGKKPEDRPTATAFRQALAHAMSALGRTYQGKPAPSYEITSDESTSSDIDLDAATLVREPHAPQGPLVVLWAMEESFAATLGMTFFKYGAQAMIWRASAVPPPEIEGHPITAVLLMGDIYAPSRVHALRNTSGSSRLPVLIIEARNEDLQSLVELGANDIAPQGESHDIICGRVHRLLYGPQRSAIGN